MTRYIDGNIIFDFATKKLTAELMPTGFIGSDAIYNRIILFYIPEIGDYWGIIKKVIDGNNVILEGKLPNKNESKYGLGLLYDFGVQAFGSYISAIDSLVKDEAKKLTIEDKVQSLNNALTDYGKDKPYIVSKLVTANGNSEYLISDILGGLWTNEYSVITSIESNMYKFDKNEYLIYDDGSKQDGTNLKLKFNKNINNDFIVRFSAMRKIPINGPPNFPVSNYTFNNIVLLGAVYQCLMLGSVFAQSIDSTISADAVNYSEKTNKYITLAKTYYKRYCLNVFGSEEPINTIQAAVVTQDIDVKTALNTPHLFHSRRGK